MPLDDAQELGDAEEMVHDIGQLQQYSPSLLFSISCLTLSPQKEYLLMTLSYKIFMVHGNFPKYDACSKKS